MKQGCPHFQQPLGFLKQETKTLQVEEEKELNYRLEVFVQYFVNEFEDKLQQYEKVFENKIAEVPSTEKVEFGKSIGGAIGKVAGNISLGAKGGSMAETMIRKMLFKSIENEASKLCDLIDLYHKNKSYFRQSLIYSGCDIFQSFEMQFRRVTTNIGPKKAMHWLAVDAVNRAINYQVEQENISINNIAKGVILGSSKIKEFFGANPNMISNKSKHEILYEYLLAKENWITSSMYKRTGLVIGTKPSYFEKNDGKSKSKKYGFRRILTSECWDCLKDSYKPSDLAKSAQFTDYDYVLNSDKIEQMCKQIDKNLSKGDPQIEELKTIISQIKDEVTFKTEPRAPIDLSIWHNVGYLIKNFIGRGNELDQIHHTFKNNKDHYTVISQITSVSGLGGVGKTELARKYAYEYRNYYDGNVIWINSETKESLGMSFEALAKELKIPIEIKVEKSDENSIIETIKKDMKSIVKDVYYYFKTKNCLFIFDNCESYKEIYEFLPVSLSLSPDFKKPYILITSRSQNWSVGSEGNIEVVQLGEFSHEEAVEYIKTALNLKDGLVEVTKLANILHRFPLALLQATAYINKKDKELKTRGSGEYCINDFITEYNREAKRRSLLDFKMQDHSRYVGTVYTTWNITLKNIEQEPSGKEALDILKVMAYLDPESIPIERLFSELIGSNLWDAITLLEQYCIAKIDKGVANIHRLMQQVIQIKSKEDRQEKEILEKVLQSLKNFLASEDIRHIVNISKYIDEYDELIVSFFLNSKCSQRSITPLFLLAENGNIQIVERLLAKVKYKHPDKLMKLVATKDERNTTLLHHLAGGGALLTLKYLIDEKKVHINAKSDNEITPIRAAARNGKLDVVKYLIQRGIPRNIKGFALLYDACYNGHLNIFKHIMEWKNSRFVALCYTDNSLLHLAVTAGAYDIVKYIIENKLADTHLLNLWGETALHIASEKNFLNIVKYLIKERKEDLYLVDDKGRTLLHSAAECGAYDVVKYLTDEAIDINMKDSLGKTALFCAAEKGHFEIVKFLIECKTDINMTDYDGKTPLQLSAENGHFDIVNYLMVERNANILLKNVKNRRTLLHLAAMHRNLKAVIYLTEKRNTDVNVADDEGQTPLHLAAKSGECDIVKYFIERNADFNLKDINGDTPLSLSFSSEDNIDVIMYLIEKSNVDINLVSTCGGTILHLAAFGNLNAVKYLTESKNADVNVIDEYGQTALHIAAGVGAFDIVKYLIEERKAEILEDSNGMTPILRSAEENHFNITNYLLDEHADIYSKDMFGRTILHLASEAGEFSIVEYLVEERNADVNLIDDFNMTPLHFATTSGAFDIVKYLIERGNANIFLRGKDNTTCLHLAAQYGNTKVLQYLTEKTADVNVTNSKSRTPLHLAAKSGEFDIVKHLIEKCNAVILKDHKGMTPLLISAKRCHFNIVSYLIEKEQLDIHLKGTIGRTILHLAAKEGEFYIVKYLIEEKNAEVNVADYKNQTPLYLAAERGAFDIVKYLIEDCNADANLTDNHGMTPLLASVTNFHFDIVKYLIENGHANINFKDSSGRSISHLAAEAGEFDIVNYLIEKRNIYVNITDYDGQTPLHFAADRGASNIVKYLINEKIADIYAKNYLHETPLHLAAKSGAYYVVKYLVKYINNINMKDIFGKTALFCAAEKGHFRIVQFLIGKCNADANMADSHGNTPVLISAETSYNVFNYLIKETNVDINMKGGQWRRTPLHTAASKCNLCAVKYLTEQRNADVNVTDDNNQTPLHLAAERGALDIVKYLNEEQKADIFKGYYEFTCLNLAVLFNELEVLKYIFEKTIQLNKSEEKRLNWHNFFVKVGISETRQFLDILSKTNILIPTVLYRDSLRYVVENGLIDQFKYLIGVKNAANVQNDFIASLLMSSAEKGHFNIFNYLVEEKNAKISAFFLLRHVKQNRTSLHLASLECNIDAVKHLTKEIKPHIVNIIDDEGRTPLHIAAERGAFDIVKHLIEECKADMTLDNHGNTPFFLSVLRGHNNIANYLIEHINSPRM